MQRKSTTQRGSNPLRKLIAATVLALAIPTAGACTFDFGDGGLEEVKATSRHIEAELGIDVDTNHNTVNGRQSVVVQLWEIPEGDITEVKATVERITLEHFPEVQEVWIAM